MKKQYIKPEIEVQKFLVASSLLQTSAGEGGWQDVEETDISTQDDPKTEEGWQF